MIKTKSIFPSTDMTYNLRHNLSDHRLPCFTIPPKHVWGQTSPENHFQGTKRNKRKVWQTHPCVCTYVNSLTLKEDQVTQSKQTHILEGILCARMTIPRKNRWCVVRNSLKAEERKHESVGPGMQGRIQLGMLAPEAKCLEELHKF